jgi:UDP-N-acetylmuramate dehydrogenase
MEHTLPDALLSLPHRRDVPFARLTTLGVGGLCRWLFEPTTEAQAQTFVRACAREGLPWKVLGGGSNLVVRGDVDVPVLRLALPREATREGDRLRAFASHGHIALAEAAAQAGLSGLEFASGIPGSLGGAIRMNAGAHGREWVEVLDRVRFLTPEGDLVERAPESGDFRYRNSFLVGGHVVLSATALLVPSDPEAIRARMAELRQKRGDSQPLGQRNAGCVFKNPEGQSAGRLIDAAGLKGLRVGDAEVSPAHANFLVNHGHASPADFLELMAQVQERVLARHGVRLEPEVELWG